MGYPGMLSYLIKGILSNPFRIHKFPRSSAWQSLAVSSLFNNRKTGISPDLFSIPWLMTCFSHVLPIDKLNHLYDSLLVGPAFPQIFVSFAILKQIRESLMDGDFSSIMMTFADLDVDVEDLIHTGELLIKLF
jgi:hypothetical protein